MSVRSILNWPDRRLSAYCTPAGAPDDALRAQISDMFDTMYDAEGRGLAAPQIGILNRVFVMDVTWKEGEGMPLAFVDPVMVAMGGERVLAAEMCLSIPGVSAQVLRAGWVELSWTAPDGTARRQRFDGDAARCIQHEMDHLDGLVTLDRLGPDDRAQALAEYAA